MKNKMSGYIIRPVLIPILICTGLLLEIYLESMCVNYARTTYNYLPLYGMRAAFCLVWAISARVVIAFRRKKGHKGKAKIEILAIVSVLVFIAIGVIDWIFLTKKLILNQAFDVVLLLAILCCVMRKK